MAKEIDIAEWLQELSRVLTEDSAGLTAQELSEKLGIGILRCRILIKKGIAGDTVEVGRKWITNIAGVSIKTPVYRMIK